MNVSGNLKIGNFTLSFTDLSIPVSGIPVTLTRTYDSLNANNQDQLGYGWRLEYRDTDLTTSVHPTTPDEQEAGIFNGYQTGSKVYITLPGGQREGFTFEPRPQERLRGLPRVLRSRVRPRSRRDRPALGRERLHAHAVG